MSNLLVKYMEKDVEHLIKKIVNELKKIKDVKIIYLFGSYAKRTEKPISDIDICIITKKNISRDKKEEIGSYSGPKVEISFFWDLPLTVQYKVLKEGKPLFQKDESFLHEVTVNTLKKYLDFKPTIEKFTRVYIGV